jgi:hypothetical protein
MDNQIIHLTEAVSQLVEEIRLLRRDLRPELERTAAVAERKQKVEKILLAAQNFTAHEVQTPYETDYEK